MLLERVAELLGSAISGAHPFCTEPPPQVQGGPHGGPARARAAPSGFQGHPNVNLAVSTGLTTAPPPPATFEGGSTTAHGPGEPPRYHSQVGIVSRTMWHMGHYGEAFGAAAPEAYAPHMVDQGHALEEDHGSFLGPRWGEETLKAELFSEPREGPVDRAGGSDYRVSLIPQE